MSIHLGYLVLSCVVDQRLALHFHLTLAPFNSSDTTTNISYDDAEFTYSPLLDEDRDRELLSILPDYLTEEICFPRNNAAKFYSRVCDCMTKKLE